MANRLWSGVLVICLVNLILEATNGSTLPKSPRTCVIGAGYSGLGVARYLKEYGVDFTVFEATKDVGGTWRFDPNVGVDEDGLPVFTSQYKGLRTNTPKQFMEYYDFAFPEGTASYPTGECMHKYLQAFARKYGFLENIQFRSLVTLVTREGDQWALTYKKSNTKETLTEFCDKIVVATGEYRSVNWPRIPGQETFKGKMIHSHDYKEPEPYRNRRVLLIGAGSSGLDLAVFLSNVTSKLIHSHHLVYNQPDLPKTYVKKPDITEFTSTGAVFQDGSYEEFDDVIFATGYNFDHSFLDKTSGVTSTGKFVLPLYNHVVNIKHPSMMFVGVSKRIINKCLDAQAHYAAAVAAGKVELPSQETMLKSWLDHVYESQRRGMKIVNVNVIGDDMDRYFGNLTQEAGIPRVPPVFITMRDFNAKNRLEDFLNFRDYEWKVLDDKSYERLYNPKQELELRCPIDV